MVADLPLPYFAARHAQPSDRHWSFKFVEFKPNEWIKLTRNPDYWKKDRPYLDAIEYTIIKEISTRNLAFFAGKFDVTSPFGVTVPTLKDSEARRRRRSAR
jgi:peptide/nickel transport system substrate-binding protein